MEGPKGYSGIFLLGPMVLVIALFLIVADRNKYVTSSVSVTRTHAPPQGLQIPQVIS